MSWTEITRKQYRRDELRYASDTTDEEWKLIERFMPAPCRRGRPRETDLRVIINAILYIAGTGCQWRALPKDFPPCSTVRYYFYKWRGSGLWRLINDALVAQMRERQGRNRRLAKDFEASIASAEAWVLIASIRLLSRRLARA